MKLFIVFIPVIAYCHATENPAAAGCRASDTSKVVQKTLEAGLALSAFREEKWSASSNHLVSMSSEMDFSRSVIHHRARQVLHVKSELNYTYIRDSLWNKNLDHVTVEYCVTSNGKSLSPVAGCFFITGLLNDHEYDYDSNNGHTRSRITGTFLNPATLEIKAGMMLQREEWLEINFDLSSARLRTFHHAKTSVANDLIPVAEYRKGVLVFDIGINIQYRFSKTFANGFEFSGNGRFFVKNLKKERIDGEIYTRLDYKITKRLRLKTDLRLRYDPVISPGIWTQTEIQTGFYYKSGR